MFYEDQHKLAAYLERTGAKWEVKNGSGGWVQSTSIPSTFVTGKGFQIRPVLRYGLPSHMQSEIHNPDNLTEEQICEGGKYRAVLKSESANQPHETFGHCSQEWSIGFYGHSVFKDYPGTYRLPATVPWPDWGQEQATKPDPKDARIAELENLLKVPEGLTRYVKELEAQLATSPWRRMSEVPTEEDADGDKCVPVMDAFGNLSLLRIYVWEHSSSLKCFEAWMPAPKFHGWPDPLTDLLKVHGVAVTPELTAALNAWKGVEK